MAFPTNKRYRNLVRIEGVDATHLICVIPGWGQELIRVPLEGVPTELYIGKSFPYRVTAEVALGAEKAADVLPTDWADTYAELQA